MKRTQIYLDESQDERLGRKAADTGVTKSTLIREALNAYLDAPNDEPTRLTRFRAAVEASAGTATYLPDGATYVETMRATDQSRQQWIERRRRR